MKNKEHVYQVIQGNKMCPLISCIKKVIYYPSIQHCVQKKLVSSNLTLLMLNLLNSKKGKSRLFWYSLCNQSLKNNSTLLLFQPKLCCSLCYGLQVFPLPALKTGVGKGASWKSSWKHHHKVILPRKITAAQLAMIWKWWNVSRPFFPAGVWDSRGETVKKWQGRA